MQGYVYGSARAGASARSPPLDPALHPALLGVAVRETPMLGAVAMWVPGTADLATRALLDAGLRIDGFPGLVVLVAPRPPVRALRPDLARARLMRSVPARTIEPPVLASRQRGSLERALGRSRHRDPSAERAHDRHHPGPAPTDPPSDPLAVRAPHRPRPPDPHRPGRRRAPRRHQALPQRQGGAQGRRPRRPRGRLRVPRRPVGRRQVDAHEAAHPRRAARPRASS